MDNDKWKTPPKIFHKPMQVYLGKIKLEFGSKKVHGRYRKPPEYYYGQYITRRGQIRRGQRKTRAKNYRFIIHFNSQDIQVDGTLREPRIWYNGTIIKISHWNGQYNIEILPQELEKICIDYGRRLVRGSVVDINGKRIVHWFAFNDPQIIVRGFREDE